MPSRPVRPALAALLLPLAAAACGGRGDEAATDSNAYAWRGPVPAGGWVRVHNTNGAVRVARAPGAEAVITASTRTRGRAAPVRFVNVRDAEGVTVCALWSARGGRCTATGYEGGTAGGGRGIVGRLVGRRGEVRVDFVVAVPAGTRVLAETVNGAVAVADAAGEVRAKSVNGGVTLAVRGGPVRAESVNGSVRAEIAGLAPGASVALSTVNGPVTAMLPALDGADVELSTVNGRAATDFALALRDSTRTALRGTLGAGGRALTLKSVNGGVNLFRRAVGS